MPLTETIKLSWNGHQGTVNYQPPEHGYDAKGREWSSRGGWFFTDDTGNSSERFEDCSEAIEVGIQTLEGRNEL